MKKLFAFVSVCLMTLGVAASAVASTEKTAEEVRNCLSPMKIEYYYDEEGVQRANVTYNPSCTRHIVVTDETYKPEKLTVRPAPHTYPSGSFVVDGGFWGPATYVPQPDGTLKRVP